MEVSSILDAYTISYGWAVYRLFFILFLSLGLILYPLAKLIFDLLTQYFEREADPKVLSKAGGLRIAIMFLVIFCGVLPAVPLKMDIAQINSPCGLTPLPTQNPDAGDYQFDFSQVKVPIVPWLAMQIASGTRGVIYSTLPCVSDVTASAQALRSLNLSAADDPVKLNQEQQRFAQECHLPSLEHYQRTMNGAYGQDAANEMRQMTKDYIEDNKTPKELILSVPSSNFLRDNFYKKPGFCEGLTEGAVMYDFCLGLPFKAQGPVDQITGADTSLLSQYQRNIGETIPTCGEWFDTPTVGLRDQLYSAAESKLAQSGSYVLSTIKSSDVPWYYGGDLTGSGVVLGNSIIDLVGGGTEGYKDFIVDRLFTNQAQAGQSLLTKQNSELANKLGTVGGIGAVAGIFGMDWAESIVQTAVSFYTGALIFRIASSLFLPLLLMAVFMFWAFYMYMSEFKGEALIQGAVIIFILSIVPGLWAIGNHLDDKLYVALFPQTESLVDILKSPSDHMERLFLEIVSTVYYVVLPIILIYIVMMAGGPKQTGQIYADTTNSPASIGANNIGGKVAKPTFDTDRKVTDRKVGSSVKSGWRGN